jgi:hypothetical protein
MDETTAVKNMMRELTAIKKYATKEVIIRTRTRELRVRFFSKPEISRAAVETITMKNCDRFSTGVSSA